MRRILHLLGSLEMGGKEHAALRLARRARAEGHEASLLLFDQPYRGDDRDFDPTPIPWVFMPRGRGLDLGFVWKLAKFLVAHEIDVVHAHNDSAHVYACLAERLAFGRPLVVVSTLHTRPHHGGGLARLLTRNAGKKGQQVYAVSRELADHVMSQGWLRRCGTIVNGVDTAAYAPEGPARDIRAELSIPSDHILFGHIARFDPIKRHQDLIAALHRLSAGNIPLTVVCVGRGTCLPEIRQQAAGLANVRFLESVVDMPAFLRAVDGVILCSDHEATPLCLLEAMACAKPIIATAVGGVPALLGSTGASAVGILLPPREPSLLAAALMKMAGDLALRQEMSRKSRQQAAGFRFEDEWASYRRIYDGLPSQPQPL